MNQIKYKTCAPIFISSYYLHLLLNSNLTARLEHSLNSYNKYTVAKNFCIRNILENWSTKYWILIKKKKKESVWCTIQCKLCINTFKGAQLVYNPLCASSSWPLDKHDRSTRRSCRRCSGMIGCFWSNWRSCWSSLSVRLRRPRRKPFSQYLCQRKKQIIMYKIIS